ncbi:hypothetical protein G647_01818 [Cladophialophora carrionii CBS 160.54]|uniref:DUF218 domain-containing protein n=1 Tax=Cladophialophora carrionii CBS 160.54 TaxID=1279043 RepID=V9DR45_9EURO|nr:uncharacterized protein G647_01818 [Cladophialophora carrionii CBS 160.54]ETI29365.1 hypothetical protein G647_01818 [Cladophialophora carrionii CBS 160.54]
MPHSTCPPRPTHLIIVCCHAIYVGGEGGCADEANWLIEPFQTGETETYIRHIEAGVKELARNQDTAILVFSGGATKRDRTVRSEGEGYLAVALEKNLFNLDTDIDTDTSPSPSTLRSRIFVDRYATDSYQNVLLPLIQFPLFAQELQSRLRGEAVSGSYDNHDSHSQARTMPAIDEDGHAAMDPNSDAKLSIPTWPAKLTVISHAFKRRRFLNLHVPAARFPGTQTTYIGIDPPFEPGRMAEIEEGDRLRGYGVWEGDLYGLGALLSGKREKRGWDEGVFRAEVVGRFAGRARRHVEGVLAFKGRGDDGRAPWETECG